MTTSRITGVSIQYATIIPHNMLNIWFGIIVICNIPTQYNSIVIIDVSKKIIKEWKTKSQATI